MGHSEDRRRSRFHCQSLDENASSGIRLVGVEAHHARNVLRLSEGEPIEVFDGQGRHAEGIVVRILRHEVEVELTDPVKHDPVPASRMIIASAVPRGDRLKWEIEKLTELGIDELWLLGFERSVTERGAGRIDKMQQTIISACKQCGRNRAMIIRPMTVFAEFLDTIRSQSFMRLLADPGGDMPLPVDSSGEQSVVVVIGPEGGLTESERERATDAEFRTVNLGSHILRVETAAVTAAAILNLHR